jgi:hypothetical protein
MKKTKNLNVFNQRVRVREQQKLREIQAEAMERLREERRYAVAGQLEDEDRFEDFVSLAEAAE